ncbi:hypothetical protein [Pantoea sp. GM01]|uniref:hypothetical protein n=1 Tax=Pantoea sp. GM01 TaxID=1144320 RepID=UPI0002710037|nr:hypothetical protein [Pantoea sp. GM01]EJL85968.1 hypothetical protein PMI17_03539 [Pantoea sp. GM01]
MEEINSAINISTLISTESLKLSLGVLVPGLIKAALPFIKRLAGIHYAEKATITEKRAEALASISNLYAKNINTATENAVKALYDVIGMQYSVKINELLLTFLRDRNISYEDRDFQGFIKIPCIKNIQNDSFNSYNKRYRKLRSVQVAFITIVSMILLIALFTFAEIAKTSSGTEQVFFIVLAMSAYFLNVFWILFMMSQFEKFRRARVFYRTFSPWLQKKLREEADIQIEQQQKLNWQNRYLRTDTQMLHHFYD